FFEVEDGIRVGHLTGVQTCALPIYLYLFSEMGTLQRGARTVPVRSTWAGRGALEKGDVFGPDNPLRTGTVRGPIQRGPRTVSVRSEERRVGKSEELSGYHAPHGVYR